MTTESVWAVYTSYEITKCVCDICGYTIFSNKTDCHKKIVVHIEETHWDELTRGVKDD